jgi:hypothetical protein
MPGASPFFHVGIKSEFQKSRVARRRQQRRACINSKGRRRARHGWRGAQEAGRQAAGPWDPPGSLVNSTAGRLGRNQSSRQTGHGTAPQAGRGNGWVRNQGGRGGAGRGWAGPRLETGRRRAGAARLGSETPGASSHAARPASAARLLRGCLRARAVRTEWMAVVRRPQASGGPFKTPGHARRSSPAEKKFAPSPLKGLGGKN